MHLRIFAAAAAFSALFALAGSSNAGVDAHFKNIQTVDSYIARLSIQDHHNSRGETLREIAHVIRQDRANFHRFNRRDPEDTNDTFFSDIDNRAILEDLVARATDENMPLHDVIVNGTPLVRVNVMEGVGPDGKILPFVMIVVISQ